MVGTTVSILLAQTTNSTNSLVSSFNFKRIKFETGFVRSHLDLAKAYKNDNWDILIINIDNEEFDYVKGIQTIQIKKGRTRILAIGKNRNRNEINTLFESGIHEFVPISDVSLFRIKIQQQIEISLQLKRIRELEYDVNYKSQFIAKISHEMRTTLNSVILLSEILAENRNQSLNKDEIEYIDLIHGSSNNLLDLLNKILDLSKIQSGKMNIQFEEIDVHDFCTRLSRLYIPVTIEKNIEFKFENNFDDLMVLNTDRLLLEQILNNLISNAIKFTNKGYVKLKTYSPSVDELLNQNIDPNEKIIAFEVSDSGIGISDDKFHVIFESYVQAEGKSTEINYGGAGLGLAISKELCQILGGKLSLESDYGTGSIFTVYVPLNSRRAVEGKPEQEVVKVIQKELINNGINEKKSTIQSNGVVLLIDNSPIHNMALKEFLNVVVKNCITVESAQEAYSLLKTNQQLDCIILDLYLPDAYGKDILQKIRTFENYKETPVIIYSGKTISKTEQKELYKDAFAIVQKNINSYKVLLEHISKIINDK